jgi:hypothetical protein
MPETSLPGDNYMYLKLKHQSAPCGLAVLELYILFSNIQYRSYTEPGTITSSLFEAKAFTLMNGSP